MNRVLLSVAATLAAVAAASSASAQDGSDAGTVIAAGVTAGTLGIGPEVGVRFSDHVGVRGNATFLGFSHDFDSDDITYRGKLKLRSFGAMVDVFPFGGSFRISGGARINSNRVDVSATPDDGATLNGNDYTSQEVGPLSGEARVKKFAPALTLGWGGGRGRGLFFGTEAGVLFQGTAKLRNFRATGTAASDPDFQADLEAERLSLQDDVDKVKVYPILQVAIGYRF